MSWSVISPEATQDLEEIIDYFLSLNVEAGERFLEQFNKKCKSLASFPNQERSYAEIEPSLRGIPLNKFIILYRVTHDEIEIVRVVGGYRDLESLFSLSEDE